MTFSSDETSQFKLHMNDNFRNSLRTALIGKFNKIPTSAQLANLYNAEIPFSVRISKETARLWLTGSSIPSSIRIEKLNNIFNQKLISLESDNYSTAFNADGEFKNQLLAYSGNLPTNQKEILLNLAKTLWQASK